MNFFGEAENLLNSIKPLKDAVKNLEERENRIIAHSGPHDVAGIDMSTTYISEAVANDALNDMLELIEVRRERKYTEAKLEAITDVVKQLPHEQQMLVDLWYVQRFTKEVIAHDMHISSQSTLYALKNKTVYNFAVRYFGAGAMKDKK